MYVYFQELVISIIIEILRLIEGIYHIYQYLFGSTDIANNGNEIYILEKVFNNYEISNIFNCIILISILIGSIYSVVSIIKNAINNNNTISTILCNFMISIIMVFVISLISLLMIALTNEGFQTLIKIFNIDFDISIGHNILDICAADYNNYYTINDINLDNINANKIFGDILYESYQLFPIAWKNNGYINPNTFLYIPCLITSIIVLFSNIYIAIVLTRRIYELVLLYIIMPIAVFTITLDNGFKLKLWFKLFIKKLLLVYIIYLSIFLFILTYQFLVRNYIHFDTYDFKILHLLFIIGGNLLLIISPKIFNILFKEKTAITNKITKIRFGETYENNA